MWWHVRNVSSMLSPLHSAAKSMRKDVVETQRLGGDVTIRAAGMLMTSFNYDSPTARANCLRLFILPSHLAVDVSDISPFGFENQRLVS